MTVAPINGADQDEVPAKNLQYSFLLNKPGACSFVLPIRHPQCTQTLLDPGKKEIRIYRGSTRVWGGYLWTAQTEGESVRFGSEGYFSRFRHRYIDATRSYAATDQVSIAADLINFTQAQDGGNLGIGTVTPASGVLRDRTYNAWERKPIAEAIEQLAAVNNGFDFEIDPDRTFRTYYPRKAGATTPIFEYRTSMKGYSVSYDATRVASEITAIGEGTESSTLLSVATDAGARVAYGLLEDSISFKDVSVQTTLDAHAVEELRARVRSRIQPQLQVYPTNPDFGTYGVGDDARVIINHGYVQINAVFRITTIVVQVSDEGSESVGVYFGEET